MIFSERLLHLWLFGLLREHLICCRKMRCFGIIFVIPHSLFLGAMAISYRNAMFEQTELFVRGIGEATDVVSKEMFTVISGGNMTKLLEGGSLKSKSKLSLRPEGTAGVVRAVVEHDLVPQGGAPAKLMYAVLCSAQSVHKKDVCVNSAR